MVGLGVNYLLSWIESSRLVGIGRGFESRLPLNKHADVAQLVEHILGKDEVTGSIPVISSK